MKQVKTYTRYFWLLSCMIIATFSANAQVPTYITSGGNSNNNYPLNNSSNNKVQWVYTPAEFAPTPPPGAITHVYFMSLNSQSSTKAFSDYRISIKQVNYSTFSTTTFETGMSVVYGPTNSNLSIASNGWFGVQLDNPFVWDGTSNLVVEATITNTNGMTVRQNTSNGTKRIWGGRTATTGSSGTGQAILGLEIANNCPTVPSVSVNAVTSKAVDFSWLAASGGIGTYDYAVTTTATPPTSAAGSTTLLTASVNNLTPSTNYYVHVRNRCALGTSSYPSLWTSTQFTTLPPCEIIPPIQVPHLDSSSARIVWQPVGTATEYEFELSNDINPPAVGTANSTVNNNIDFTGLESGKTYYFHIRVKCTGNDSSAWYTDSIYVPIPCRKPVIDFTDVNSNRVVVYWSEPQTAKEYEVIVSAAPLNNPQNGIKQAGTSRLFSYLDPNKTYYTYVKAYCDDRSINTESDWASSTISTWPTSVDDLGHEKQRISIYPNPAKNEINILCNEELLTEGSVVRILDLTGKLLSKHVLTSEITKVNIGHYPLGVYVVEYVSDKNKEQMKLLIQ